MSQCLQPHILYKYDIIQKLGKGAYGIVWKAIQKQTNKIVAIKKIFDAFQNSTDAQRTFRQVMFLQQLKDHPNIINLLQIIKAQNNKDIYLIFNFMQTDLHAVIRANIMQNIHKKYILYQILKSLKYMHTGQLIHRDLKPSNILLDADCHVKVADFGLARSIASSNQSFNQPIMTQYVATRWYRAPQILLGSSKYTKAVDMWSIGCILGQMYLGKAIFPGNSTINQLERIIQLLGQPTKSQIDSIQSVMAQQCLSQIHFPKKKSFIAYFNTMDSVALDLIKKLLAFNPNHRLDIKQALNHPYFADFHEETEEIAFKGIIKIPIDQSIKFSIKEYRDALYHQINAKKQTRIKSSYMDEYKEYVQHKNNKNNRDRDNRQHKNGHQQQIRGQTKKIQCNKNREVCKNRQGISKQNKTFYVQRENSRQRYIKTSNKSIYERECRYIQKSNNNNIGRRK